MVTRNANEFNVAMMPLEVAWYMYAGSSKLRVDVRADADAETFMCFSTSLQLFSFVSPSVFFIDTHDVVGCCTRMEN